MLKDRLQLVYQKANRWVSPRTASPQTRISGWAPARWGGSSGSCSNTANWKGYSSLSLTPTMTLLLIWGKGGEQLTRANSRCPSESGSLGSPWNHKWNSRGWKKVKEERQIFHTYDLFLLLGTKKGKTPPTMTQMAVKMKTGTHEAPIVEQSPFQPFNSFINLGAQPQFQIYIASPFFFCFVFSFICI